MSLHGPSLPVTIERLTVRYGATVAVDDLSLAIAPGEIMALLGPSGCGKTTTLKAVTGLQTADAGVIRFGDRDVTRVAAHRRQVGMVFQNYALFPHLTVAENVAFGLARQGVPGPERERRVAAALDLLRIGELAARYPAQLSGGQQQRVALARTLAPAPAVLLLDEPLSALDRQLREEMRRDLRHLLKEVGVTAIIVTHDQDEAMTLADRIAVMRAGRIEQLGAPREVYARPRTRFVASFLGRSSYLRGVVTGAELGRVTVALGSTVVVAAGEAGLPGQAVTLAIRPEALAFADSADAATFAGTVESSVYSGGVTEWVVRLADGQTLLAAATDNAAPPAAEIGAHITLFLPPDRAVLVAE